MILTDMDRLMRKVVVDLPRGCWLWCAARDDLGYGYFWYNGRQQMAYRASYQMFRGAIPLGLVLDHVCRVPRCVNPWHLDAVTQKENLRRSPLTVGSKNTAKTTCNAGHAFDEQNTYTHAATGKRKCRACGRRNRMRRYYDVKGDDID